MAKQGFNDDHSYDYVDLMEEKDRNFVLIQDQFLL